MKHTASTILYTYWDGLRGERTAPERSEIDPAAIRQILADTFILEVDAACQFPFRLAGTRVCALFGRELKGVPFPELWPPRAVQEPLSLVEAVLTEREGVVAGLSAATRGGIKHELELLLLPLRHGGKTHSRILGCLTADSVPPWIGLDPIVTQQLTAMRIIRPAGSEEPSQGFGWARRLAALARSVPRRGHLSVYEGGRSDDAGQPGSQGRPDLQTTD